MGNLLRDLQHSIRILLQNPGFAAVALLSLALGIGATTTIFSVFAKVMFRSVPVEEPDRLVVISKTRPLEGGFRRLNNAELLELMKQSRVVEDWGLTSIGAGSATLTGMGKAVRVRAGRLDSKFFSVADVQPALGRPCDPDAERIGEFGTALLSHGFWQRYFGGREDALGQQIRIEDGSPKVVIGVMRPGFWIHPWAKETDLWECSRYSQLTSRPTGRSAVPIGRVKADRTIGEVQAEMDVIFQRLAELYPEENKGWRIRVQTIQNWGTWRYGETLYLLLGAVGFVLLIACVNVANLLLARATSREKEIAIRASLGAGRGGLLQQLLSESLVLGLMGGVLGVVLTFVGVRIFVVMAPTWFSADEQINVDWLVLGFVLAVSVMAGILVGLVPAIQVSGSDLHGSLKEGGRRSRGSGSRSRVALLVTEVALALVLLVGAGLMVRSFLRLHQSDNGFNPDNVLITEVFLSRNNYWEDIGEIKGNMKRITPRGLAFFEQTLERIRALPGVISASTAGLAPPGRWSYRDKIRIAGRPPPADGTERHVAYSEVSPSLFETLQIPLLRGRYLTEQDVEGSTWVVVINEAMAEKFFPNENPIGKSLYLSFVPYSLSFDVEEGRPREIVGIVGNTKRWDVREGPSPLMYGSHKQHIWEYPGGRYESHLHKDFVIRSATDPMALAPQVQKIITEVDPNQVIYRTRTMEQTLEELAAPERFSMRLYGIFAAIAVFLAAVGIYGVMSYTVSQRTHEFGVRMAMGAQKSDVLKLVLKYGLKLTLIGLAIGMVASLWLTKLISGFLYGVTATDPLTYTAVSIFLLGVAIAACYFPARWATKVDPLVALRHE